jgi:hypothetical protein
MAQADQETARTLESLDDDTRRWIRLLTAQIEIGSRMGYPLEGRYDRRYTAIKFALDLNMLHSGIVRTHNGLPHQLYNARRRAIRVPPWWDPTIAELLRLARIGFIYPPTPGPLGPRP